MVNKINLFKNLKNTLLLKIIFTKIFEIKFSSQKINKNVTLNIRFIKY